MSVKGFLDWVNWCRKKPPWVKASLFCDLEFWTSLSICCYRLPDWMQCDQLPHALVTEPSLTWQILPRNCELNKTLPSRSDFYQAFYHNKRTNLGISLDLACLGCSYVWHISCKESIMHMMLQELACRSRGWYDSCGKYWIPIWAPQENEDHHGTNIWPMGCGGDLQTQRI